jgi:prealbumin domain-containing protein
MRPLRLRGRPFGRLLLLAIAATTFAVFFVAASSGNLTGSTFESTDGNLVKNTGTDWCNAVNGSGVCTSTAPHLVQGQDKAPGNGDDSFANGTKQDDAVPSIGNGGIPNKGDLDRFYVANEFVGGKNFAYLGFELLPVPNASASVHTGFEFNKNFCDPVTHAGCSANNVTPARSAGDILIVFDLEGGGNPALSFRRWVLSGSCEVSQDTAPCWGPKQSLSSSVADGSLDNGASGTTDPINPGAPRTIGQYRFGEAAINISDSGILSGCAALGSVYTVSRSSGDSGTATMKDFIAPQKVNINNCGTIIAKKVTDPSPDTTNTSFSFTAGGGLTPTSFSLKNGETKTYSGVNPGNGYTLAESVPTGWDLTSSTCDDGSPVTNIDVSAGETVTCTFTNKARGTIKIKKVTDPSSDTTTSFSFTAGGLSPSSFSLHNGDTQTFSNLLPGNGYSVSEDSKTGWDLTSSSCDDGSPLSAIDVGPGETVTCTFNNRQRGSVSIHKQDDAGNALQGAVFELYTDNAPVGGNPPHGAEDTATGQTCTTDSGGDCTISNVVPGQYWIVETTTPTGYDSAADKNVTVGAGQNVPVTLTDLRKFRVIVVVCQQGTNDSLHASSVTVDGVTKTSLASGGGGSLSDSDVCGLGGARYSDKHAGDHPNADVNIP